MVKRLRVPPPVGPLAEAGLSYLIKVTAGAQSHTVLFDAGISGDCLLHNAKILASSLAVMLGQVTADLKDVEAVIVSHGHFDHFGGLPVFLGWAKKHLPVFIQAGAFVSRRYQVLPDLRADMPKIDEEALIKGGADIKRIEDAAVIAGGLVMISGKVVRQTDFEKGMPGMEAQINGEWVADPFHDDQGLALNLKGRGLIIIGGCSHAGIVNTAKHLQKASKIDKVHAVLGGFHLTGANEKIIEPSIAAMKKIAPAHIVPMHCTGWRAINAFAREMPESFILNSVGTTYIFQSQVAAG